MKKALFGAGCFWGVQHYFDQVPGVLRSRVGYSGGHTDRPTYEEVCSHSTGHAEVVELSFDEKVVSFRTLVRHFFRMHDPTQLNRQGLDVGDNYRSIILYYDDEQREITLAEKQAAAEQFVTPIATEVVPYKKFFAGEAYHQKFAERTGRGVCHVPYSPLPLG